jgi:hypothetical protein
MSDGSSVLPGRRRQAKPVRISATGEARILAEAEPKTHDEAWLQRRIHEHPELLPIWDIEPAFWPAVPVCMELPLSSGFVDNLLVNPDGNLVLVECKLWRNPEARRKVIAQIIEYARSLASLDYEQLEAQVRQAQEVTGTSLYQIAHAEISEAEFIDAVSRNLRLGRFLLLIAGDGIQESVESLTEYLQQHAGIHFTLALVQLTIHDDADGSALIVPSIPLRTVNIVRGIVEIIEGRPKVSEAPRSTSPETLTEEQFFEGLDRIRAGTSARLRALLQRGEAVGLRHEMKKTLVLRVQLGPLGEATVATIYRNGEIYTEFIWLHRELVGTDILKAFEAEWVAAIPSAYATDAKRMPNIRLPDRTLLVWDLLDHQDAWLAAIDRFRTTVIESRIEQT